MISTRRRGSEAAESDAGDSRDEDIQLEAPRADAADGAAAAAVDRSSVQRPLRWTSGRREAGGVRRRDRRRRARRRTEASAAAGRGARPTSRSSATRPSPSSAKPRSTRTPSASGRPPRRAAATKRAEGGAAGAAADAAGDAAARAAARAAQRARSSDGGRRSRRTGARGQRGGAARRRRVRRAGARRRVRSGRRRHAKTTRSRTRSRPRSPRARRSASRSPTAEPVEVEPPRVRRQRAAILVRDELESILAALVLARDRRTIVSFRVAPQEGLMDFFKGPATDIADNVDVLVVGFSAQPRPEGGARYRGALPRPAAVVRSSRVGDRGSRAPARGARTRLDRDRGQRGEPARRGEPGDRAAQPLHRQARRPVRAKALGDGHAEVGQSRGRADQAHVARRRASTARRSCRCSSGKPTDLPSAPDVYYAETSWVEENDPRIVHFGEYQLAVARVPANLDAGEVGRRLRLRTGARLSLATREGDDIVVLSCNDEKRPLNVSGLLDVGRRPAALGDTEEWRGPDRPRAHRRPARAPGAHGGADRRDRAPSLRALRLGRVRAAHQGDLSLDPGRIDLGRAGRASSCAPPAATSAARTATSLTRWSPAAARSSTSTR